MSDEEETNVETLETKEDVKPMSKRKARKHAYRMKMEDLMATYKNIMVIGVDNVGSNQLQKTRIALRGQAVILMGKNTIMRKVIRDNLENHPQFEVLLPHVRGNMGFVFTNEDLSIVRKIVLENKVPAAARAGANAPSDVFIPPGATGLDPGQTSFFQALNIATKIARGSIEILNRVHLIKEGDRVTSSSVALLSKLNILPFFYGIETHVVLENGSLYAAKFLDMEESDILARFWTGVNMIAAIGLQIGCPSAATVPHSLTSAFRKLVAISVATEYEFELSKPFKEYLANPSAFASAAGGEEEDEDEESSEEEDESSDGGGAAGLFGDDSDEE